VSRFPLSLVLRSLPLDPGPACGRAVELGFTHVDVVALENRPPEDLEALADSGLLVACAELGQGLPDGGALDASSIEARQGALAILERQVADAALLGATRVSLPTGKETDTRALLLFAEGIELLSESAARRMVRVCLEPNLQGSLATATATLNWLETRGPAEVGLLLDVDSCLRNGEDPVEMMRRAGPRLAHVRLSAGSEPIPGASFGRFQATLEAIGYQGALAYEALGP
jgi:sugar phosphate isomerase/epimerase